jgi:hypothetical protein
MTNASWPGDGSWVPVVDVRVPGSAWLATAWGAAGGGRLRLIGRRHRIPMRRLNGLPVHAHVL